MFRVEGIGLSMYLYAMSRYTHFGDMFCRLQWRQTGRV